MMDREEFLKKWSAFLSEDLRHEFEEDLGAVTDNDRTDMALDAMEWEREVTC